MADINGGSGLQDELTHVGTSADWVGAVAVAQNGAEAEEPDAALFLRAADVLLADAKVDAAEACLEEAVGRWPDNVWLPFKRAEIATWHRSFEVAEARWQHLQEQHPESPLGLCGIATLYRNNGLEEKASELFARATAEHPGYVWAADGHAITSTIQRNWSEAASRWRTVLERFPDHFRAHHELLAALIEGERLEEAKAVAQRGLDMFPDDTSFRVLMNRLDTSIHEDSIELYIISVFQHLLQREPEANEISSWKQQIAAGLSERSFYRKVLHSHEYGKRPRVVPGHILGNYYSPIVDPSEARKDWQRSVETDVSGIDGIHIDLEAMVDFWNRSIPFIKTLNFEELPGGSTRYYYENEIFPNGDAVILSAMINEHRPKRIIEIGSGMSSIAMLDAVERAGLEDFNLTCIEPYANRLRSLLRPEDHAKVTIIEKMVQDVQASEFQVLEAGDILFIDSSHVMKTGSDVHYEMFNILPVIKPGVIIQIHDIQFPFEYPERWVFEGRWSWNEIYVVRTMLANNAKYRVIFFNDLFFKQRKQLTNGVIPGDRWPMNPLIGASIWLQKQA